MNALPNASSRHRMNKTSCRSSCRTVDVRRLLDKQWRNIKMVTRGFTGRPSHGQRSSLPPGQHLVTDFPVLSAGPTPRISTEDWIFSLKIGPRVRTTWTWAEFNALPQTDMTRDIHCVTTWSKLDTRWQGV